MADAAGAWDAPDDGDGSRPPSATTPVTVNPCTLCAPLGAVLAAAGVEGAMPLLHGAQGCATYIRRYLISHFREPVDVASSSFTEASAVLGGEDDFTRALDNVRRQYDPRLIAVGTTCLAETIGEDLQLMVRRYRESRSTHLPIVYASTPSYRDGHVEGYHATVCALVRELAEPCANVTETSAGSSASNRINVLVPIVSPADLRHLREIVACYTSTLTLLPDYSDRLDAPIHENYRFIAEGGTKLADIRQMSSARMTIDLTLPGRAKGAHELLEEQGVPTSRLELPIGVEATDAFIAVLARAVERRTPTWLENERGRLLDAYADGHKYVYGKRVAVYGDPELVVSVAKFLAEIGARPVLCATGARNRALSTRLNELQLTGVEELIEDTDFSTIEHHSRALGVDLMIGNSKGYRAARANGVPLLRLGFPIHDRIGAGRLLSVGYRGSVWLFDSIVNTLIRQTQETSTVGFSYL